MDAIKTGVELHEKLEEIFNRQTSVNPEAFSAINPEVAKEPAFRRSLENYHNALEDLDRLLNGETPKLRTVFEETLRNDGIYEYTSTGSCDGSQSFAFRRKPAIAANPSSWESIDEIPEEAKYNND